MSFQKEVKDLVEKYKKDGEPIMTLTEFLQDCVAAYDDTVKVG